MASSRRREPSLILFFSLSFVLFDDRTIGDWDGGMARQVIEDLQDALTSGDQGAFSTETISVQVRGERDTVYNARALFVLWIKFAVFCCRAEGCRFARSDGSPGRFSHRVVVGPCERHGIVRVGCVVLLEVCTFVLLSLLRLKSYVAKHVFDVDVFPLVHTGR